MSNNGFMLRGQCVDAVQFDDMYFTFFQEQYTVTQTGFNILRFLKQSDGTWHRMFLQRDTSTGLTTTLYDNVMSATAYKIVPCDTTSPYDFNAQLFEIAVGASLLTFATGAGIGLVLNILRRGSRI